MVAIFSTYSKHEGHVSTGPEVEVRNMVDGTLDARVIGRRSFLRGSALFAAAVGLGVASSAFGQEQQQKPTPADPFAEEEKYGKDKENETKVDKEGREYRSCPQCGSNMYKQGRTWTCENCGYSYVE
jgi:ribosomal protein S27AE